MWVTGGAKWGRVVGVSGATEMGGGGWKGAEEWRVGGVGNKGRVRAG